MDAPLSTAVWRDFAGDRRKFQLCIGQVKELEQIRGAGIGEIYLRISTIRYTIGDLRETIRLGLVGGGTPEVNADALVKAFFVDGAPLSPFHALASSILLALFEGMDAEGNVGGVKRGPERDASDGRATLPHSTKPVPPPASVPGRSMQ